MTSTSAFPPLTLRAWLRYDVVSRLISRLRPRTTLEIGCGQGAFGARLAGQGAYLGVEPDARSFEIAKSRIEPRGGTVLNGMDTVVPGGTQFDMVCAFEVLEHIEDDKGALANWVEYVRPGGHVVLSVPAFQSRFGPMDAHAGHFRRYSPAEIADLLTAAGLTDVTVTVYGWPFGYALESVRNRIDAKKLEATDATVAELTAASGRTFQPGNRVMGAATALATLPWRLVQRLRPGAGTGLVAVATRPDPNAAAIATPSHEARGERMVEGNYHGSPGDYLIYLEHIVTYDWAAERAAGARVLDFGTGTGYGAARLADRAASVTGVDVSPEAVAYATERYGRPTLDFVRIDPVETTPLPFADESFDLVTSFQVIEHVPSPAAYLAEAHRVLRPGGTLLCVTPDRATRLYPRQRPWNQFHLHEFAPEELTSLIAAQFDVTEVLGMTAPPHILQHELSRYSLLKRVSYPFTFPHAPEPWRQLGLTLLKRLNERRTGAARTAEAPDFGFGPEVVEISPQASPSINVMIVATRR